MADRQFDSKQRLRPVFTRSADGRLRPVSQGSDIGDVWAEQRRIRLAEAIEQDKLKAAKEAKKQQKGRLFSREVAGVTPAVKSKANQPKEIALTISLPNLPRLPKLPKFPALTVIYKKFPKPRKRSLLIGSGVVSAAIVGFGVYSLLGSQHDGGRQVSDKSSTGVLSANSHAVQTPEYSTILPKGKDISALGGWGRVSPSDRDPVFAYADKIGGVRLTVSEQPLPANFKTNVNDEVGNLAKQFIATDKLNAADGVPAYVGSASRTGPQSVIVAKHDLLIFIKSDTKLSDLQWVQYIDSLQ